MNSVFHVEGVTEIPKSAKRDCTNEQLTVQIMCTMEFEEEADYFYDVDGSTIYAKAPSGLWKITCDDMRFLHQSKN